MVKVDLIKKHNNILANAHLACEIIKVKLINLFVFSSNICEESRD